MIEIKIHLSSDIKSQADNFYKSCGSEGKVDSLDVLVVAYDDNEMVGLVRLCRENGFYVLRTMRVRESYQKKGVGLSLLRNFQDLIVSSKILKTYCIPYLHLESFYEKIGFKKITEENAPDFLIQRIRSMRIKKPLEKFIIMLRS